jgi:hypothetical protein
MKRYWITGHMKEDKWPERKKEIDEGLRKTVFDTFGEGQPIFMADFEEGGFGMVVECEGSPEAFLADFIPFADLEIKPLQLCPQDCYACPENLLVKPLRES